MQLRFAPLTHAQALDVAAWRYPPPYDFYNGSEDPDDLRELLDPAGPYYGAVDERGDLIGFLCFGETAQVPAGHDAGAYAADALDIGLGMRPDLTGRGLGLPFVLAALAFADATFHPAAFRLSAAAFNLRAIRVYERAGFLPAARFNVDMAGIAHEFVVMTRPAGPARSPG